MVIPEVQPGTAVRLQSCQLTAVQSWAVAGTTLQSGVLYASLCLDAHTTVCCTDVALSAFPYCNTSLGLDTRTADFVSRLSISDAVGLMSRSAGVPRLGLPVVNYYEALHGIRSDLCLPQPSPGSTGCATSFPNGVAEGATFNRSLWSAVAGAISTEGRAMYNLIGGPSTATLAYYAPNLNPFVDPRWGRGQEVCGEDPYVLSQYAAAFVRGMQEGEDARYLKTVATCKHWVAYGMEEADGYTRYDFDANVTWRDLVSYHFPPFKACVQQGRGASAMCSYNAVNGVPMCANEFLNQQVLRQQWGFTGVMGSDCGAVGYLLDGSGGHNYTNTTDGMMRAAVHDGGCDIACDSAYPAHLADAVASGAVPAADVAASLTRIVALYIRLGLLDPPAGIVYNGYGAERVDTPEHRSLALQAALQAMTLLQNRAAVASPNGAGTPVLPLPAGGGSGGALRRLAVIGPHANSTTALLSNYFGNNTLVMQHSPLAAIAARLAAAGGAVELVYAPGCADILCNTTDGVAAAVAAATGADAAVLLLGINSVGAYGHFAGAVEGEALDRVDIGLPGFQQQLAAAVAAAPARGGGALPVAAVLINGGPVAVDGLIALVPAILEAYYPGELGGDAVAAALFGDVSPAGRLPYTVYPASFVGTRRATDMSMTGGEGVTYQYYTGTPLWPFGWGLSYTTFNFTWSDGAAAWAAGDSATAGVDIDAGEWAAGRAAPPPLSVRITNTGTVASDVSALAFVAADAPAPGEPLQQLFDFARAAALAPGASATLYFTLDAEAAAVVTEAGARVLQPRLLRLQLGGVTREGGRAAAAAAAAAGSLVQATLRITGAPVTLSDPLRAGQAEARTPSDLSDMVERGAWPRVL